MYFNIVVIRLLLMIVMMMVFNIYKVTSIVNTYQETANMVIYMRQPSEILATPWQTGVNCLQQYMRIVYQPAKRLTRAQNMVLSIVQNLSSPTDQIQEAYIQKLNQAFMQTKSREESFQLRIISDNYEFNGTTTTTTTTTTIDGNWLLSDFYVLIVDSIECLERMMWHLQANKLSWNANAIFLVMYHNADYYTMNNTLISQLFHVMTQKVVYRAGLLYAISENTYIYLQLHYFNTESCRSIRWRQIGNCENGNVQPDFHTVFLKQKTFLRSTNLRNCTFEVCATIASPFIESNCNSGIEFSYLEYLSNNLKFRLNINCFDEARGTVGKQGKWNGLLGKLANGKCDIAIGGYYPDNEAVTDFWTSQAYLEDSHTWFIKLAEEKPQWKALMDIFQLNTWLCFLATLFLTWLTWYFLVLLLPEPLSHKELSLTAINAMALSLCVAVNERPLCYASRVFFLILSIYGLNVVALYTSQLIVIFKDPGYLKQIQNLNEVVAANIPYGGPAENIDWFEENEEWIAENYNDTEVFQPNSENLFDVARGERVILSGRMFVEQSNVSDKIFGFTHNVFSSPLVFFMRYGNPFQYAIDRQLIYASDFGMSRRIFMQFQFNNTYLNRISKMRPHFVENTIVLTMEHLEGPFYVLVCGFIASLTAFFGELLKHWILLYLTKNKKSKTRKLTTTSIATNRKIVTKLHHKRKKQNYKRVTKVRFNEREFNKWKINKNADTFTQYTWLD